MEIIIKNGETLSLTNIPDNELSAVKANNEEVITTFSITEEDKKKLGKGCTLNADFTVSETEVYLENIASEIKAEKREAILALASETDQINLIASVLDTITSETPDLELIEKAKTTFNEIKTILNN